MRIDKQQSKYNLKFEKLKRTLDQNYNDFKSGADTKKNKCGDFAFVLNDAVVSNEEVSFPAANSSYAR